MRRAAAYEETSWFTGSDTSESVQTPGVISDAKLGLMLLSGGGCPELLPSRFCSSSWLVVNPVYKDWLAAEARTAGSAACRPPLPEKARKTVVGALNALTAFWQHFQS